MDDTMIVHPDHIQDPKFFFSDLEVLLRRYGAELHIAVVTTPVGPIPVAGFTGPRWTTTCDANVISHKTARMLYDVYANPEVAAERMRVQAAKRKGA